MHKLLYEILIWYWNYEILGIPDKKSFTSRNPEQTLWYQSHPSVHFILCPWIYYILTIIYKPNLKSTNSILYLIFQSISRSTYIRNYNTTEATRTYFNLIIVRGYKQRMTNAHNTMHAGSKPFVARMISTPSTDFPQKSYRMRIVNMCMKIKELLLS